MRIIPGLLSLSIATAAVAQDAPPIAKYVPSSPHPEHVFVFDSAHVLSTQTSAALQDSARALQTETGADIVWVTLPTLGGRPIEEAALYIGRTWRVGSAGTPGDPLRNRGLVILYVPDKTKTAGSNFRIEVGNGLEGTITDSRSRAISAAMRKDLKAKRYDEGYLAGWNVATGLVREDAVAAGAKAAIAAAPVSPPVTQATTPDRDPGGVIAIVMMIGIGILVLLVVASRQQTASGAAPRARRRGNDNNDTSTWTPSPRVDYSSPPSMDFGSSSSFDSGSSSGGGGGGGDLGGGGGFSGGGSSDTI